MAEKFVLNLIEKTKFSFSDGMSIGYWDGKVYRGDDVRYPGVIYNCSIHQKNEPRMP